MPCSECPWALGACVTEGTWFRAGLVGGALFLIESGLVFVVGVVQMWARKEANQAILGSLCLEFLLLYSAALFNGLDASSVNMTGRFYLSETSDDG